jgi:hypothetical protein
VIAQPTPDDYGGGGGLSFQREVALGLARATPAVITLTAKLWPDVWKHMPTLMTLGLGLITPDLDFQFTTIGAGDIVWKGVR